MKYYSICLLLLILNTQVYTQEAGINDPEAQQLLEDLSKKIDAWTDVSYAFTLKIDWPEQPAESIKGSFEQQGIQYRLDLPDYLYVSDGESQWIVDKKAKEVQIHDYVATTKGADITSPQALLSIYENPNFAYQLIYDGPHEGKSIQRVEFKPLDRDSDYSKARLTIDKKSNLMKSIELFLKNGVKYVVEINETEQNKGLAKDLFVVVPIKYPDYHIEDLRF